MKFRRFAPSTLVLALVCLPSCDRKSSQLAATAPTTAVTEIDPFADLTSSDAESKPQRKYADRNDEFGEIVLFSKNEEPKVGLRVEILEPVVWSSPSKAHFVYRITNCTDDEVFVEIRDLHKAQVSYSGPEGSWSSGVEGSVGFYENQVLLKRLVPDLDSFSAGEVQASADISFSSEKGKITIGICLRGYYRSTGKKFIEWIDLPLPIKK